MVTMLSFSNRIVSYPVASMVLVFSHQSLWPCHSEMAPLTTLIWTHLEG
jgi:hypothetical protein